MNRRFLHCCRKIIHQASPDARSVICEKWLKPLKIITSVSLIAHLIYRLLIPAQFYSSWLIIIHLLLAFLIFAECKRSAYYFRTIREYEKLDRRRKVALGEECSQLTGRYC